MNPLNMQIVVYTAIPIALKATKPGSDSSTLNRIKEVTALPDEDRKQAFMLADALVRDFKAKKTYAH